MHKYSCGAQRSMGKAAGRAAIDVMYKLGLVLLWYPVLVFSFIGFGEIWGYLWSL
jgi:hypothetical protein